LSKQIGKAEKRFVPTADEYRRLAAECLELAPNISPDLRAIFVVLAKGWANLADYLEEDHTTLPDSPPVGDGEPP
jgi:hypothetical protein